MIRQEGRNGTERQQSSDTTQAEGGLVGKIQLRVNSHSFVVVVCLFVLFYKSFNLCRVKLRHLSKTLLSIYAQREHTDALCFLPEEQ